MTITGKFTKEQVEEMVRAAVLKQMVGFKIVSVQITHAGQYEDREFDGYEATVEKKRRYEQKKKVPDEMSK